MKNTSDICIVGAGIGGLSCVTQLINSGDCNNLRIRVFDANKAVGGRIQSHTIEGHEIVELGAARYSPQLHPRFRKLMHERGLANAIYPFTGSAPHQLERQKLKATLLGLRPMLQAHPRDSFVDFASCYLGRAEAVGMIKGTGYDALLLPMISAAMAYDILSKHPETQDLIDSTANQWLYAPGGYSALLSGLQRQAEAAGVDFFLEHRLLGVEKSGADYLLVFNRSGETEVHRTRHLVMAVPPSAMPGLNLNFPTAWSRLQYSSLPLFKGFLTFDEPWWHTLGWTDKVVISDSPLRKIYFKGNKYLQFYSDSESATYWRDSLTLGEDVYLARVRQHLAQMLPLDGLVIPPIKAHIHKYWPHGVEFCLEPELEHPPVLLHENGIIACSDAYTAHAGWMEGSLISAEQAANVLLERLNRYTGSGFDTTLTSFPGWYA